MQTNHIRDTIDRRLVSKKQVLFIFQVFNRPSFKKLELCLFKNKDNGLLHNCRNFTFSITLTLTLTLIILILTLTLTIENLKFRQS